VKKRDRSIPGEEKNGETVKQTRTIDWKENQLKGGHTLTICGGSMVSPGAVRREIIPLPTDSEKKSGVK